MILLNNKADESCQFTPLMKDFEEFGLAVHNK